MESSGAAFDGKVNVGVGKKDQQDRALDAIKGRNRRSLVSITNKLHRGDCMVKHRRLVGKRDLE